MVDLFASGSLPMLTRGVLALLFDLTLKGTLILALAGLMTTLLRKTSASTRHQIWCLALGSVLLLPVLTVTLPAWRLPIMADIPYLQQVTASLNEAFIDAPPPVAQTASSSGAEGAAPDSEGGASAAPPPAYEAMSGPFFRLYEIARAASWPVWLLFIWAGGVAVILFRFLFGTAGVAWLAYRARPIHDPAWTRLTDELRRSLGLRRRVRLLRSVRTAMPMTWGVLRPVVLLPVRADDWSEARRRCVLAHELAHVRRWDCLTQTLAQGVCALNWFNPLAWSAARRMRHERERACDDYVLSGPVRPSDYAAHLLDIARTTRTTLVTPLGAVAMARASQLESRVLSILDAACKRGAPGRSGMAGRILLTAALVAPLAAMQPANREAAPSSGQHAFQRLATIGSVITITPARNQTARLPEKVKIHAPKDDIHPARQDRPVYRPIYRAAVRPTQPFVAEARRTPAARPEPGPTPHARSADLDLDASLARLRRQVSRLGEDLTNDLFEGAAQALNGLDLGVAVNPRDLVELAQIVDGQDARYARQMERLGFDDVTREELLLARLVGVNAFYVRSVRDAGYCPSLKEFVALKIAGVNRQYLQNMASEGFEAVPVKALVELRASGVEKTVLHEREAHGIRTPTLEYPSEHGPVPK